MLRNLLVLMLALHLSSLVNAKTFSSDNPAKIFMVLWRGCEEACQGFQQQLAAQQLPVEITLRDAGRDKQKLAVFLAQAKALKPDLVVTWGTSVSKAIIGPIPAENQRDNHQYLGDIPAMFIIVADPIGAGIIKDYQSSGRANVTGIRNRVPEDVQIRTIKDYLDTGNPDYKPNIGIIYNPTELNSALNAEKLTLLSNSLNFTLTKLQYQLDSQGKPTSNQLPALMSEMVERNVDIVYVGSSSYNRANSSEFIHQATKAKLPVASPYEVMVTKDSALIAVANRYYNVGKLAAIQARKVLFEQQVPGDLPIASLSRYSIFINMQSARKLKTYPPIQLLRLAELVNSHPETSP